MNRLLGILALAASGLALADADIPLDEYGFVDSAPSTSKAKLIDQLGEPSHIYHITDARTGDVLATIWHYHYINTSPDGEYYKTTELDFVGEHMVNIVFSMQEDTAMAAAGDSTTECTPTC